MQYEKVADQFGSWGPKLRPFIESPAFDAIFKTLKDRAREGVTICPASPDVFRTFKETPYDRLKAVFLLQDPYPWMKNGVMVADGIPMSCRNTKVLQPSLELFYHGMQEDLKINIPRQPDLTYLANEGVLILNASLTVELNKPGSHAGIWDPFIKYLIEEVINFYNTGLPYVSFGKNAHVLAKSFVPFLHYPFEVEHPAAAAHKEREWKHENIFSKIDKITKENNGELINWAYGQQRDISSDKDNGKHKQSPAEMGTGIRGKVLKD